MLLRLLLMHSPALLPVRDNLTREPTYPQRETQNVRDAQRRGGGQHGPRNSVKRQDGHHAEGHPRGLCEEGDAEPDCDFLISSKREAFPSDSTRWKR